MRTPTNAPPFRPVSESEAAQVFRDLKAAMEVVGLPSDGLYRDVRRGAEGGADIHVYGLGVVTLSGAKRLAALLHAARREG
ncbi:hypothetical protein OG393_11255 [Streptomyces sp. NBC_01216]|uniref:hypothetical protein n=1 Tax=Streptomyces sp. NBC_01216 TaxID=2903778 RepID=UPI002E0FE63B|nr:hypothetical protein OG393_11255 [Streptomyces sp. NBC_01216]